MDNDVVKRLAWSAMLAGVGASPASWRHRQARRRATIYVRVFGEDPRRVSGDVHTPTSAGPDHIGARDVGRRRPGIECAQRRTDKPEVQVGAAFAGGLVAAMILKRIFARD